MKIMIMQELVPPSVGGQEIRSSGFARALAAAGHAVTILAVAHVAGVPRLELVDGVTIERHPVDPRYVRPGGGRRWPTIIRYSWWTRRELRRHHPDLVIYFQWPMLHTVLRPRQLKDRTVIDWCETRNDRVSRLAQRLLPRLAALNTAVSQGVADRVCRQSGRRTYVVPTGVDLPVAAATTPRRGLLSVGRITAHKNLHLLIDGFVDARLRGYCDDLTIAGSGPDAATLDDYVQRLPADVSQHIHLIGHTDEDTKASLMREAQWFMVTSSREGFPVSVVEAMSVGLPTITVDLPDNGTCDVVAQFDSGRIVPAEADAIGRAILDDADWERLCANAAAAGAHFEWPAVTNRFLQLVAEETSVTTGAWS